MIEAFFAEDAPVLSREQLAAMAPETWTNLRFAVVPSLQLLTCAWPVHAIRERFDHEDSETAWDEAPRLAEENDSHPRVEERRTGAISSDGPHRARGAQRRRLRRDL